MVPSAEQWEGVIASLHSLKANDPMSSGSLRWWYDLLVSPEAVGWLEVVWCVRLDPGSATPVGFQVLTVQEACRVQA